LHSRSAPLLATTLATSLASPGVLTIPRISPCAGHPDWV